MVLTTWGTLVAVSQPHDSCSRHLNRKIIWSIFGGRAVRSGAHVTWRHSSWHVDSREGNKMNSARTAIVVLTLLLAACSGNEGTPPPPSAPLGPGISITAPTTFTETCNDVTLAGFAGVVGRLRLPANSVEESTNVNVTWRNDANGQSGEAVQNLLCGPLVGCSHTWQTLVSIVVGDNPITVMATDLTTGATSTDTITINKPFMTYTISGTFLSHLGIPPGRTSSTFITKDGSGVSETAGVQSDGSYRFACVPDGIYTLTPSSTINYTFSPTGLTVRVAGADITGQHFVAHAFPISGRVTWASSGSPATGVAVRLSGSGSIATASTSENGDYSLLVPNGTYSLTLIDNFSGLSIPSTPPSRNVTVNNVDVTDQHFIR